MAGLRRAVLTNRLKAGALAAVAGLVAMSLLIMLIEAIGHFFRRSTNGSARILDSFRGDLGQLGNCLADPEIYGLCSHGSKTGG